MKTRKKCNVCGKPLVAFEVMYLHPSSVCSGWPDGMKIEVDEIDATVHKKFEKMYGTPIQSDYERLNKLEKNWIVKMVSKWIK